MILVEKDRHLKKVSPFWEAHVELNNWYINSEYNSAQNSFISLGDWYDTAIPTPEEIDETERFINAINMNMYFLGGNHDWSGSEKSYSILNLRNIGHVEVILEPCVKVIEGKKFAFLPFIKENMKELYENLSEEFINADYICYHFEDETINFGKRKVGIDLSYLKGKRLGGHIHTQQKNYELGMPVNSNIKEKNQENGFYIIDKGWNSLPKLVDYYELDYNTEIVKVEAKYPIFDIKKAPSKKLAVKFCSENNIFYREVEIENKKQANIKDNKGRDSSSLQDFFSAYVKSRQDLTEESISHLNNCICNYTI